MNTPRSRMIRDTLTALGLVASFVVIAYALAIVEAVQ